ncbi:MAG: hypothetical protein KC503_15780 [Myxococcales bacterium]|nr:hypothetical protein [Myxococcales bacterium]
MQPSWRWLAARLFAIGLLSLFVTPALAHRGHRKKSSAAKRARTPAKDAGGAVSRPDSGARSEASAQRSTTDAAANRGSAAVSPPATPTPSAPSKHSDDGLADLIGKLHPMAVHVPIGWLLLLLLVDAATFLLKKHSWEPAGRLLLLAATLSMLPAVATGLLRHATHGPSDAEAMIVLHRNVMLAMAAASAAALGLRLSRREGLRGAYRAGYLLLIAASAALLLVGGHLGGKIVFGADYLPF